MCFCCSTSLVASEHRLEIRPVMIESSSVSSRRALHALGTGRAPSETFEAVSDTFLRVTIQGTPAGSRYGIFNTKFIRLVLLQFDW